MSDDSDIAVIPAEPSTSKSSLAGPGRPYACDVCNFIAIRPHDLIQHKKTHTLYGCSQCEYRSFKRSDVELHIATHLASSASTNVKIYTCELCSFKSDLHCDFLVHITTHRLGSALECGNCGFRTFQRNALRRHLARHTGEDKWFECGPCDYYTKFHGSILTHIGTHPKSSDALYHFLTIKGDTHQKRIIKAPLYQCKQCGFYTGRKDQFVRHEASHTSFACTQCCYVTQEKSSIDDHVAAHHKEVPTPENREMKHPEPKIHKCDICDFTTNLEKDIRSHMFTHSNKTSFSCSTCSYRSMSVSNFNKHVRSLGHVAPRFECYHCQFKTYLKPTLRQHMQEHDFWPNDEIPFWKKYSILYCNYCEYSSQCKRNMQSHLLLHPERIQKGELLGTSKADSTDCNFNRLVCTICDFQAVSVDSLKRHHLRKHGDIWYACKLCGYRRRTLSLLITHFKNIHDGKRRFGCRFCGFKAVSRSTLASHESTHSSEKPLKCDICPYSTRRAADLRRHVSRKHGPQKKLFECRECETRFYDQKELDRHTKVHTGDDLQYGCSVCGNRVTTLRRLRMHVLEIHAQRDERGEDEFSCRLCDFKVSGANNMATHALSAHSQATGDTLKH